MRLRHLRLRSSWVSSWGWEFVGPGAKAGLSSEEEES